MSRDDFNNSKLFDKFPINIRQAAGITKPEKSPSNRKCTYRSSLSLFLSSLNNFASLDAFPGLQINIFVNNDHGDSFRSEK